MIYTPFGSIFKWCYNQNHVTMNSVVSRNVLNWTGYKDVGIYISDKEMYSTVYTNQTYEPDVFQVPESKVSSERGY